MDKLAWDLNQLCRRNRDGSHTTQYQRSRSLRAMSKDLRELGYRQMRAGSLKPKHATALVERWREQGLSSDTIRNRCAHLRWWSEHVGKPGVVPSNADLGLPARSYDPTPRAQELDQRLDSVTSPHVRASLELQAAFGLRREEAMKLQPGVADQGDRLRLEGSWCKGGREREIPIETPEQRAALDRAHELAGRGSMIPADRSYVQHLRHWERETRMAGLSRTHGLRHQYAQNRYETLTGRAAPAAGGASARELTAQQRAEDREARQAISRELGHERIAITSVYLGR